MNVVVGRLQMHAAGYGFVVPDGRRRARPLHRRGRTSRRRCTAIASSRASSTSAAIGPRAGSSASSSARNSRLVGRFEPDESGLGYVVPFDAACSPTCRCRPGEIAERAAGRDGRRRDHALADGHARRRSAASSRCSATSTSRASTPTIIIRKHSIPDAHGDEAIAEARRLGGAVRRARHRGPHRLPPSSDGHDRRRARARFRRCDHASRSCRTATTGWACTSPTCRTTSTRAARSTTKPTSAARRCTSPSAPCTCFPSELATGLCSLNPHVDRLVQSCLMEVDARRARWCAHEFHDGVINSDARMTYTAVNAILTDRDPAGDGASTRRWCRCSS